MAAPSDGVIATEPFAETVDEDLEVDFDRMYVGGRVPNPRKRPEPFYKKLNLPGWQKKVLRDTRRRGQFDLQLKRRAGLV